MITEQQRRRLSLFIGILLLVGPIVVLIVSGLMVMWEKDPGFIKFLGFATGYGFTVWWLLKYGTSRRF